MKNKLTYVLDVIGAKVIDEITDVAGESIKDWYSNASKEISERKKEMERLGKDKAMAELKMLEHKRVSMAFTKEYNELDAEGKRNANEEMRKKISLVIQEGKLTSEQQNYSKAQGQILMEVARKERDDEMARVAAEQRKREEEELRDLRFQSAAAGMNALNQGVHNNYSYYDCELCYKYRFVA